MHRSEKNLENRRDRDEKAAEFVNNDMLFFMREGKIGVCPPTTSLTSSIWMNGSFISMTVLNVHGVQLEML